MQGKLVLQDTNEESAEILLGRISEEKERLIKENLIKKELPLPLINEEDIPFDIPESWKWVRLGEISSKVHYGYTASAQDKGNAKLLRITDIQNNYVDWANVPYCNVDEKKIDSIILKNRDILIARTGGTIGKSFLITDVKEESVFASYLIRVQPLTDIDEMYLTYFLQSEIYWQQLRGMSAGTGQPNVNAQNLKKLLLPLPPLNEQKRIVKKIEELVLKLQKYDLLYEESVKINETFPSKLEISILDYAMQGKLVEQDPNEESATILIEHIRKEKELLVQKKVIKKEKSLPPINDEEIPFDIPRSWEWVRIKEIYYNEGQVKPEVQFCYIDVSSIDNSKGRIRDEYSIISPLEAPSRARKIINSGDVIYSTVRPYLQNIAIVDREFEHPAIASTAFVVMRPIYINNKFLYYVLKSPFFNYSVGAKMLGATYPAINDTNFNNLLIPIPPLKEQKRIVAKIEELLRMTKRIL
ncbi:restriction endonuclease subunit S [Solibacillus isronensis]|uniref:restriction endonuclease subunit S n=1 Tax=Solibacillus isronensis TaxID=412383 RepID=UPI0009A8638A|nr:restriction endonuclease subunit S [Solibacillus isronensis]